ncbi:hypothetical protein J4Q44_G00287480, partial [Coregonus suidteri]
MQSLKERQPAELCPELSLPFQLHLTRTQRRKVLSIEVTHKVRTCQGESVVQQGMLYCRPSMRVPAASWGCLLPRALLRGYLGPN